MPYENIKTAIVTTTINIPVVIESYIENFKQYSVNLDNIMFLIIGDRKSPHQDIKKYLKRISPDFYVEYMDIETQKNWISKTYGSNMIEKVDFTIPYNSIRRRNLGYLRALDLGAQIIITIDDDNYARNTNWLYEHLNAIYNKKDIPLVSSKNHFVNPCHILQFNQNAKIYSRGYPFTRLFSDTFDVLYTNDDRKTVLNMGLWTKSPDVDAYTNIMYPNIESMGIMKEYNKTYAIAPNNYMPINTQNTAFRKEIAPAFYDVLMDHEVYNMRIDRYDDIWAGYFVLKLIHRMNHRATFGVPLTIHLRNKHDFVSDFKSELLCMSLNERIIEIIMNVNIQSKNYRDGYVELAQILRENIKKYFSDSKILKYFSKLTKAMNIWVELVEWVI